MIEQELEQIRTIVNDALAPVKAAQAATDGKIDRLDAKVGQVLERVNDVMAVQVRMRTEARNEDVHARLEALEAQRRD